MKILLDRVAVVTGAAGGIGRALVLELARSGMHLTLAGRDEQGMEQLAAEVRGLGRRCIVVRTDVRELSQIENLLARTLSEYGACHLMVNNAGIVQAAPLLDAPLELWQRVVDVNMWGVLRGCRVFGSYFASRGEGHIVNVASWGGLFPAPGFTMYSASKFAVVGFTYQLRWELAASGVGVTLVIPGLVKSSILDRPDAGLGHLNTGLVMKFSSSAEGLARRVRRGVQTNRALVRYGVDAYLMGALGKLPIPLMDPIGKIFARVTLLMVGRKKAAEPSAPTASATDSATAN